MSGLLLLVLVVASLLMSAQAAYTVYLMLYTWGHDAENEAARAPDTFRLPQISFTALLPAHHEEEVIGQTLEACRWPWWMNATQAEPARPGCPRWC